MRGRAITIITTAALVLGACGGSDDDADTGSDDAASEEAADAGEPAESAVSEEAASGGTAGSTYAGELEDGTMLTISLDVDESDPLVAPFVDFREQAGATDPVVWITGSLEVPSDMATGGTGRYLTFVEPGGDVMSEDTTFIAEFACGKLDDWFGAPTGDEGAALNEAYIAIVADSCAGQTLGVIAEAGATTDYVLIYAGTDLPEFESIYAGLLTELQPVG